MTEMIISFVTTTIAYALLGSGLVVMVGSSFIVCCWVSDFVIDRVIKSFDLQAIFWKCAHAHFKAKADARRGGVI